MFARKQTSKQLKFYSALCSVLSLSFAMFFSFSVPCTLILSGEFTVIHHIYIYKCIGACHWPVDLSCRAKTYVHRLMYIMYIYMFVQWHYQSHRESKCTHCTSSNGRFSQTTKHERISVHISCQIE